MATISQSPAASPTTPVRRGAWRRNPGAWATLTWLALAPVAFVAPELIGLSPFGLAGAALPLLVGVLALAVVCVIARRHGGATIAGVAAGTFAGWVLYTLRSGLYGTPLPFEAGGDTTRLMAMAERYTTTLHSADGIVGTVPSDYPPLFPWVVGRLSVILDIPAWRLVAPVEMVLASAVVIAGFLLWRRLVSDWCACAIAIVTFAAFLTPAKAYEWMAVALIVPWALATFTRDHGRRPLGWLAAGVIGGLQILLYQGYLMFLAVGIAALIVITWRRSPDPRAFALYVVRVVVVAGVVSSWFLVPYLSWAVTHGLQMTDRYRDPMIDEGPYVVLSFTIVGVLVAVGIVGVVKYRHRAWWARPLLWLILSAFVFRVIGRTEYLRTGQTLVFPYTVHPITVALAAAGVLTLAGAGPTLARRLAAGRPDIGRPALALLVAVVGIWAWSEWIPGAAAGGIVLPSVPGTGSVASSSFLQALPDGQYPRFAPATGRYPWFPTTPIITDVHAILGAHATPLTLSDNELLFAFEPWPGYLGVGANAAASTSHWYSRLASLQHLATINHPDTFATASAHTPYGSINVFILQADDGHWDWTPTNYPAQVRFTPSQFDSPAFVIDHDLPGDTELIIRRPTR